LAKKPMSGGSPNIAADAMMVPIKLTVIGSRRPPSMVMSRVPVPWSMAPTTRNSPAL
jgi:hypothetical protein